MNYLYLKQGGDGVKGIDDKAEWVWGICPGLLTQCTPTSLTRPRLRPLLLSYPIPPGTHRLHV